MLIPPLPATSTPGDNAALLPLREIIRAETRHIHDRLHGHDGFSKIKDGTIGRADYRHLLGRLHGFYCPFEAAAGTEGDRTAWLEDDLTALNGGYPAKGTLSPRAPIPLLDTACRRLGARYMSEGSALGGRELARGLDRLLGRGVRHGRSFFIGRGAGTGEAWRSYLACLAAAPTEAAARAEIVGAAVETFLVFKDWAAGWRTETHV